LPGSRLLAACPLPPAPHAVGSNAGATSATDRPFQLLYLVAPLITATPVITATPAAGVGSFPPDRCLLTYGSVRSVRVRRGRPKVARRLAPARREVRVRGSAPGRTVAGSRGGLHNPGDVASVNPRAGSKGSGCSAALGVGWGRRRASPRVCVDQHATSDLGQEPAPALTSTPARLKSVRYSPPDGGGFGDGAETADGESRD
jgi:hypothetical protein